jgi:hypothetical protein
MIKTVQIGDKSAEQLFPDGLVQSLYLARSLVLA